MRVAGVTYTVRAIDVVILPWESDQESDELVWRHISLNPRGDGDEEQSFDAARTLRKRFQGAVDWYGVELVYLERSVGFRNQTPLVRVQGAILASLPASAIVTELARPEWKRLYVDRASADAADVRARGRQLGYDFGEGPEGAWDALGVTWVGREQNRDGIEQARCA